MRYTTIKKLALYEKIAKQYGITDYSPQSVLSCPEAGTSRDSYDEEKEKLIKKWIEYRARAGG